MSDLFNQRLFADVDAFLAYLSTLDPDQAQQAIDFLLDPPPSKDITPDGTETT